MSKIRACLQAGDLARVAVAVLGTKGNVWAGDLAPRSEACGHCGAAVHEQALIDTQFPKTTRTAVSTSALSQGIEGISSVGLELVETFLRARVVGRQTRFLTSESL